MKVGDYVRTKSGFIDSVININDFREPSMKYALEQPSWNDDVVFIGEEDIIKSSPNIIDLIEVGDYVNGYKVEEVLKDSVSYRGTDDYIYDCGEIKSILTKEQFERMEYKIGDKE